MKFNNQLVSSYIFTCEGLEAHTANVLSNSYQHWVIFTDVFLFYIFLIFLNENEILTKMSDRDIISFAAIIFNGMSWSICLYFQDPSPAVWTHGAHVLVAFKSRLESSFKSLVVLLWPMSWTDSKHYLSRSLWLWTKARSHSVRPGSGGWAHPANGRHLAAAYTLHFCSDLVKTGKRASSATEMPRMMG